MTVDPTLLAKAIVDEMKSNGHALWLDHEQHAVQHEFIAQMIEERKERAARRKRIEEKIAGSLVAGCLARLRAFELDTQGLIK